MRLVCLVSVAVLLAFFVVLVPSLVKEKDFRLIRIFTVDAEKGLLRQRLFWASIIFPLFISMSFGINVWIDYEFFPTLSGYEKFLEISKFPLLLLAMLVPLSVIVARAHATEQTAAQIKNTKSQIELSAAQFELSQNQFYLLAKKNNMDSYFSFRGYFFDYFEGVKIFLAGEVCSESPHPRVFNNLFVGKPEEGVPKVNVVFFNDMGLKVVDIQKDFFDFISESGDYD